MFKNITTFKDLIIALGKWRVNLYFKEKFQVHKNPRYFPIPGHREVILPEPAINKPTCVFACVNLCFGHQTHQILNPRRQEPCLLYISRKLSLAQKILTTVDKNSTSRRRWLKRNSPERRREINDVTWNFVDVNTKSKNSGISQNGKKMWAKTETLTKLHAR